MTLLSKFVEKELQPGFWDSLFKKVSQRAYIEARQKNLSTEVANENNEKNRYSNVVPYDQNRVILSSSEPTTTDYINASPVNISKANRSYILTQGPVVNSNVDFWRMIWQKNISTIIMLNKVIEGDMLRCEQYFPTSEESPVQFDFVTVTLESEENNDNFVVRKMMINITGEAEGVVITHVQYTEWPDFGVPECTDHFLEMLDFIKNLGVLTVKSSDPPVVVHCSAGIGRSGTFVLIDSVLRMVELGVDPSDISIEDLVISMRCQRQGVVQTPGQLRFACKAIVDGIAKMKSEKLSSGDVATDASPVMNKRKSECQDDGEERLSKRVRQDDGSYLQTGSSRENDREEP